MLETVPCDIILKLFASISTLYRHLRLELLEGVVAYHSGQIEKSRKSLTSAQAKFLQVSLSFFFLLVKLMTVAYCSLY